MALSRPEADEHVRSWEAALAEGAYSHRRHWPSRLFHHAPLENAVSILLSGCIRSRRDPYNPLQRNIAGRGVIDTREDAHTFVRLYFRPRTPTQFHIEGIRKADECEEYGFQAPVLVMFILDARQLLCREGTHFSAENMQKRNAPFSDDPAFFQEIPFQKVYHEGGLSHDRSIVAHRCAEVLATSPLELQNNLQWIYCRSEAERNTLLHKLGAEAEHWRDIIRVSEDIRVFNRLFTYVEHVHISEQGVVFELHPRNDGKNVSLKIVAVNQDGNVVVDFRAQDFTPYPPQGKRWHTPTPLTPGRYDVTIWLEGEEAFQAQLSLEDTLL